MQVLIRFSAVSLGVALLTALWAPSAFTFEFFDDGGGAGLPDCAICHSVLANTGPGNAAHDTHADLSNGDCNSCHQNGEGPGRNSPPLANCVRCHGRAEDGAPSADF